MRGYHTILLDIENIEPEAFEGNRSFHGNVVKATWEITY
ncbi:hypothetical protein SPACI_051490 [Sporomusa acidovorans DSM 3132]|uniref:Uncharacterized protein n=1 Tax=Sporomusa acidovorans (strain ATCC 49682 / DSM 3132 / Mol) TaxID=1123286 RepID=A0ABZ3J9L1_SPOA4|nr:hypothetical protein SPACI_50580 [Sporomusa acidovorans DSM 3132]SDF43911.1 hypothetical protein SAMN04488499_104920 [Sporomusa acidovorans]